MEAQQKTPVEAILDQVGHLTVNDLLALTRDLRERFDLPDLLVVPTVTSTVPVDERTEWSVRVMAVVGAKVAAIKAVRETTGFGLKESKDLVEHLPHDLATGLSRADAQALVERLTAGGLSAELV